MDAGFCTAIMVGKKPNPNKSEGYFLIGDAAISLS